jgi:mannitol 2-dehydrogenase
MTDIVEGNQGELERGSQKSSPQENWGTFMGRESEKIIRMERAAAGVDGPALTERYNQLSDKNYSNISEDKCKLPHYPRQNLDVGIVHIGGGANFLRSYWAPIIHDMMQKQPEGWEQWGILPVSLRKDYPELDRQKGLYTCVECSHDGKLVEKPEIIGSLVGHAFFHSERDPDIGSRVLDQMARESSKIVSLTITQDGYYLDPSGQLDFNNWEIKNDLENLRATSKNPYAARPTTAIGLMVAALRIRQEKYAESVRPFSVLSLDNLPGAGEKVRDAVIAFANEIDPDLARWIEKDGAFPKTMVDRITPELESSYFPEGHMGKIADLMPVRTEPYRALVVEDNFSCGRPPIDNIPGVVITDDVEPYGEMKAAMVNGIHTVLACLGSRMGPEGLMVHELIRMPGFKDFIYEMMKDEIAPNLRPVKHWDTEEYIQASIERLMNQGLPDRITRLGAELERKVPKYILPMIRRGLESGTSIEKLGLPVACWMAATRRRDEYEKPIHLRVNSDKEKLIQKAGQKGLEGLFKLDLIFGEDLPQDSRFLKAVRTGLKLINAGYLKKVIGKYL